MFRALGPPPECRDQSAPKRDPFTARFTGQVLGAAGEPEPPYRTIRFFRPFGGPSLGQFHLESAGTSEDSGG